MRRPHPAIPATVIVSALLLVSAGVPAARAQEAKAERTLKAELSGADVERFAVENLVGAMSVVRGDGDKVVAVATVHAESDEVAGLVKLEKVAGEHGEPVLRVRYPLDRFSTIRTPRKGSGAKEGGAEGWLAHWLSGWAGSTGTEYDGHRVKVSGSDGVLVWADVEVRVPARDVEAVFRNVVGALSAKGVRGKVKLDTGSGDVTVAEAKGRISADTGSGNVSVSGVEGSLDVDTGSGDCDLSGVRGERVKVDTGSGDVRVSDARVDAIVVDTGSGDVDLTGIDAEDLRADTGSGNVSLRAKGGRLARVKVDTGSGDVTLRLGPDAGFEATADQGSGEIHNRYADAQPILRKKELVGYRRGDGRIHIDVDTGSGDLTLEPGS